MSKKDKRDNVSDIVTVTMPIVNVTPATPEVETVIPAVIETAPVTAETPATRTPAVTLVPAVRSVVDTLAALPLAVLLAAMRAVKHSTGAWWYMHSVDGNFGTGTPATRYTHRVAVVSGRGDRLPDGTVAYASCVLYGLLFGDNGQCDFSKSRAWNESTKNPAHASPTRVDPTRVVHGLPSTAGNSSLSLQCANTAGSKVTIYLNRDNGAPCIEITPKGGRFMLSAVVDETGAPVTA